tara:strand:- start:868 stop:1650 length:783 start_codon:yes stop_codon:yes gene_type:complete
MTQVDGNTTVQGDIKLNYQSDIYTPPPVVYLRMNEGTATTAADSSNAGNSLDGTLGGTASWSTEFKNGPYAVEFDGDSDYIDMDNDTALAPSTAFSISYWVRANSFTGYTRMVSKYPTGAGSPSYSYTILTGNGTGQVRFFVMQASNAGSGTVVMTDSAELTVDTWHHVVCTYSGANTRMRVYVDGTLKDITLTGTVPSSINQGTAKLSLGANLAGSIGARQYWDGYMDEFSLWNVELTANQISYLYGNGVPPNVSVGIP